MQSCGGYPWFPSVSDAGVMTSFTHAIAPTQYAEGNLDDHDPALSNVVGHSMGAWSPGGHRCLPGPSQPHDQVDQERDGIFLVTPWHGPRPARQS